MDEENKIEDCPTVQELNSLAEIFKIMTTLTSDGRKRTLKWLSSKFEGDRYSIGDVFDGTIDKLKDFEIDRA